MATGTPQENLRHAMPAQDPEVRRHNFDEVALGYRRRMKRRCAASSAVARCA
jgi:hypothetical protein